MQPSSECVESKQSKGSNLQDSVRRLKSHITRLESLCSEIEGSPQLDSSAKCETTQLPSVPLSALLTELPNEIRELAERIDRAIANLREMLI